MRPNRRAEVAGTGQAELAKVSQDEPRYQRPKVLVIDGLHVASMLCDRGYNMDFGTFGSVVSLPVKNGYWPFETDASLPGLTEKEVVVVDLAAPPEIKSIDALSVPQRGVQYVWTQVFKETIDPRPLAAWREQAVMDRIHRHGGVFIIFTAARSAVSYVAGAVSELFGLQSRGEIALSKWDCLKELDYLSVTTDTGEEMYVADNGVARTLGLDGYFTDGNYQCVLEPSAMIKGRWITLAVSKFDLPIAGIIFPDPDAEHKGWIIILPQVKRSAELVADLLERVLPTLAPHLFPNTEGSRWTRRPEYQLPCVAELRGKITAVEEAFRHQIRELEERIETEQEQYAFLDDLLTTSGDILVQAVMRTLKLIGFTDVRDADADAKAAGNNGPRREDIHIMDARMPVIVEAKGIAGLPSEEDALQILKYLRPRMREWERTDIHGLTIINHQRNLPALNREHTRVFQDDVLINAVEQDFTLLTTWDLYRLARGVIMHGWKRSDVEELFLTRGRMSPVPAHYIPLGTISQVWKDASAFGVQLEAKRLRIGVRLAYELLVDFAEEDVASLEVDNQPIDEAAAGARVGIKTSLIHKLRKGTKLYIVESRNTQVGANEDQ
jgi:hypothetical protein